MQDLSIALNARVIWAMHKIAVVAGDVGISLVRAYEAREEASTAGYHAWPDPDVPNLLSDVPELRAAWNYGWKERDRMGQPIAWMGSWTGDMTGLRETRPVVAQDGADFLPGLEVSYQGGDYPPRYTGARKSLDEAIEAAKVMEDEWHAADAESEFPLAIICHPLPMAPLNKSREVP